MTSPPVHTSEVKNYLKCRLLWFWQAPKPRGLFLEPNVPRAPLFLGRLHHKALQLHYDKKVPSARALQELVLAAREELEGADDSLWPGELEKIEEGLTQGIDILAGYDNWARVRDRSLRFIATETPWEFKLSKGLFLAGRFDALVQEGKYLWVLDFKTTKLRSTDWTSQDLQATVYTYAARRLFGSRVRGVIFRFIRKKVPLGTDALTLQDGSLTQRKDVADLTTLESFELALAVAVLRETLAGHCHSDALGLGLLATAPTQQLEQVLCSEERKQQPWYPEFQESYSLARKFYWNSLQELRAKNSFFWEVVEERTDVEVANYFRHVLLPAAKEMLSTKKNRWIGPTGLGASFAVCSNCSFRIPCQQAMSGEDFRDTLHKSFKERKEYDEEELNG